MGRFDLALGRKRIAPTVVYFYCANADFCINRSDRMVNHCIKSKPCKWQRLSATEADELRKAEQEKRELAQADEDSRHGYGR